MDIGSSFITLPKSWEQLKAIIASQHLPLRYEEETETYTIFTIDNPIVYICTLWKNEVPHGVAYGRNPANPETVQVQNDSDKDDFESNYLENANSAIAKRNTSGAAIIAPTYFTIDESWRMEGIRFTASGNTTTICDYHINKEILMQGGQWWTLTTGMDDVADFSVVDKDNTLGLHTMYGLPPGYPIELKKFVNNYYVPPGITTGMIQAPTVSPVVSGLYVRIAYDNNGDDDAEIAVNYIYYEKA